MDNQLPRLSFDRVVSAVTAVKQRLINATSALESAGVPHALTDDNAIAAWVASVEPAAVRNTPDITIIIRRADFAAAKSVMESSGFVPHLVSEKQLFLDDPASKRGVQFYFANERVIPASTAAHPDLAESMLLGALRVVSIPAIVRTKLGTFRDVDRLNLRDLIDVGLIDHTWPVRYPPELAARLQSLLDTPGG